MLRRNGFTGLLAFLVLLGGCLSPEKTTGGSVEENEILAGTLVLQDGTPVGDAVVTLYPIDHLPELPAPKRGAGSADGAGRGVAFETRTDADGRYSVDSLPMGSYNVLGGKGALAFYRDSLRLVQGARAVITDTLRNPGSLTGVAAVQPDHDPQSVTVQVLGTDTYVNVDASGRFTLRGLAAGEYSLKVSTTLDEYTALYASVTVRSGTEDSLRDTLRLIYTGIPVVLGLKVSLDTAAGTARFSWNPVAYRQFSRYAVYRDKGLTWTAAPVSLGATRDTFWVDTLYPAKNGDYGLASGNLATGSSWSYRVKAQSLAGREGEFHGSADLNSLPPSWVRTHIGLEAFGTLSGEASLQDTVRIVARFRNRTRSPIRVVWLQSGDGRPLRTENLPGRPFSGADTLAFAGDSLGTVRILCRVFDESGDSAQASLEFRYAPQPPVALAGADTLVWRGASIRLQGAGTTRFGRIVKREWDIGGKGVFRESADGASDFTAPDSFASIPCIFRVTNQDGEWGLDTLVVTVGEAWEKADGNLPFLGNGARAVAFRDRLWMIGGRVGKDNQGYLYSTSNGTDWIRETEVPGVAARTNHAVALINGRLWILAGENNRTGEDYSDIWSSPNGTQWDRENGVTPFAYGALFAEYDGRAWIAPDLGQTPNLLGATYSSITGKEWDSHIISEDRQAIARTGYTFGSFGGHLVLIGGRTGHNYLLRGTLVTSENGKEWKTWQMGSHLQRSEHSMAIGGGRIWVIGGVDDSGAPLRTTANSENDPFNWHGGPPLPEPIGKESVSYYFQGTIWVVYNGALWRLR